MHMVGIQGSDIVDGTKTLVLGLVWQLMRSVTLGIFPSTIRLTLHCERSRLSISQTLASLSKDGRGVSDVEMVKWANETVKKGGKTSTMRSFKDPSLSTGIFFLDLLNGIKPGYVDYSLVTTGRDADEKKQNGTLWSCTVTLRIFTRVIPTAKLAISIARKLNALIFLVPEGESQN